MKKLTLATAILAAFAGNVAHAEEAATHAFAFNAGATSDYRFRGISQNRGRPAVFAGADYTHSPTGFYAGAWTSNIGWIRDLGGKGDVELDIYGGKRGAFGAVSYDVGLVRYYYPGNELQSNGINVNANTTEAYAQLGYDVFSVKYSHALTNFIGWGPGTDGSNYIDLSYNPEIKDGYILNLHYGKQVVKNYMNGKGDYSDWKIGVTKDFGFLVGALAVVGTDADKTTDGYNFGGKRYLGDTRVLATVTKNF